MSKKAKIIGIVCLVVGVVSILCGLLFSGNKEFNVSFDTDGGSFIPLQLVKENEKVTKPTDPIKEGYLFVGWTYQNSYYYFTEPVSSDMTLVAVWQVEVKEKHKITFSLNGKEKELEVSDIQEIDLQDLGFEEKSGYVIKWYLNDKEFNFEEKLSEDVKLTGKYVKAVSYTVKFNSDGGTKVKNQTVLVGAKAEEPKDVIKEGYIFDGWYLKNDKYDFDTLVEKSITLTAKWIDDPSVIKYTLKFDSDGGSKVNEQIVIENKKAVEPSRPTKDGYVFDGWYLKDEKYDFSKKVINDITLKAHWRELIKYNVTFDSDGGNYVYGQVVNENDKVVQPSDPVKNNFVFYGWYLNNDKYDFNKPVINDITLTAHWMEDKKYTVKFDSAGGSSVSSQTIYENGKVTRPSNPTKSGFTFDGWYLNNVEYNFNSVVTSNMTLVAHWTSVETSNLENAKSAIQSSYNITTGGQVISVTSSGCTITLSNPNSIAKITRGTSDTEVTLNFNITCGSLTDTKSSRGIIKASPYKYTAVANSNMLNYDVTIDGLTGNGKIYTSGGTWLDDVTNGKAVINNGDISVFPNFLLLVGSDTNTKYIVTKK